MCLADTIVLVSKSEKKVSSSDGHNLAVSSPLFPQRLRDVERRLADLTEAFAANNWQRIGEITEEDCLSMHAIAESSGVSYRTPLTFSICDWVVQQRKLGLQAYFTIDAGPNVHILSKLADQKILAARLRESFPRVELFEDETGEGPCL